VLRHNAGHVGDKYGRLAAACGLPPSADLAAEIEGLNTRIGLPNSLAGMGIPTGKVDAIAAQAQADHSTPTNPRGMTTDAYAALLRAAL
jgi:4-hydroxybutyrate dehydrogenase